MFKPVEISSKSPEADSILGDVALGYSPFIDRNRTVTATRLTVLPLKPANHLDAAVLLAGIATVWPADGGLVSIDVTNASLLHDLLRAGPSKNLMIEIPAEMALDPANAEAIQAVHKFGNILLLKGRPVVAVPKDVLHCFTYSIIDLSDDRRVVAGERVSPDGVTRTVGYVQSGIASVADMEASFTRGAAAVLGWPIDDAITIATKAAGPSGSAARTDMQVIVEMMQRVDREESVEKLEATLRREPTLSYRLLRHINSPAFGLRTEVSSLRQVIMLMGYQKLKRWLALLLTTSTKDANMRPVIFAAVRRGLIMEELSRANPECNVAMRDEIFVGGVFSLLDRIFKEPIEQLLKSVMASADVCEALVSGTGPIAPYLRLVKSLEVGSLPDFLASAAETGMSIEQINRAQLKALAAAAQVD